MYILRKTKCVNYIVTLTYTVTNTAATSIKYSIFKIVRLTDNNSVKIAVVANNYQKYLLKSTLCTQYIVKNMIVQRTHPTYL